MPCVAVFDTGTPAEHQILAPYCRGRFIAPDVVGRPAEHGSRVASRVVFGAQDFSEGTRSVVGACRFLDVNVAGGMGSIHEKSVFDALRGVVGAYPDVRVFNFSFGAEHSLEHYDVVERRERLLMVQDLDNFIFANDVAVVVAAGNAPSGVAPSRPYPDHVDDVSWKLGHWASGFNSMVCGSSVGRLSPDGAVNNIGWPSPFTRIGPGLCDCPVPGFSAHGGNRNSQHSFSAGLGVWVCSSVGRWEDHSGTSYAAPILARDVAFALDLLHQHCESGARPFCVTAKAYLALTASKPYERDVPQRVLELCKRTLGRGHASAERLRTPSPASAVFVWQGVLERPSDTALVQFPIPERWLRNAKEPMLRIVVAGDVPVNEAVNDLWACRKITPRLRPGPGIPAIRPRRGESHRSYPLIERIYRLGNANIVPNGDTWLLELSYEEIADHYAGIDFTPQQRIAFAAELFDDSDDAVSPQSVIQSLPVSATMNRLSVPPVILRSPVVLKSRL